MRILIFSLAFEPYVGGAEVAIREITDRLPSYEFDMLTLDLKGGLPSFEQVGNVRVHRLSGGKYSYIFKAFFRAVRMHKKNRYDLSWAMMASYAGGAAYLFKLRYPSVPLLLSIQEGDPIEHIKRRVRFVYPLFVNFFKRVDYIQAISNYLAQFARSMGAVAPVAVVPNGVDVSMFDIGRESVGARTMREKFDRFFETFDDEHAPPYRYVITTSRLVLKNGVDDCIRALVHLPVDVKLVIAGSGPDEEVLKKLALELNVGVRVFFAGSIPNHDLPSYLGASDVFIRPSLSEGLGNSFLEAMAARVPIIGTPVGGIPDFLKDGETGLFCGVRNPQDLAAKISQLLADPILVRKITDAAYALVADRFSWHGISEKMSQIFDLSVSSYAHKNSRASWILIAASIYPPDPGGPALHAERYVREFSHLGYATSAVALTHFRKFPFGIKHLVYMYFLALKALRSDLIYAMDAFSVGYPALIVSRIFHKPLAVRVGGDVVWERAGETGTAMSLGDYYARGYHLQTRSFRIAQKVLRRAKAVIVPTKLLADIYVRYYGVLAERIHIVPNPIEKQEFFVGERTRSILFGSRLVAYKNLSFVLRSLARLMRSIEPLNFIVCGSGPERESLEKLVSELGIEHNVRFKGVVSEEYITQELKHVMVAIAPALTEFNPNFVMRAISLGTPFLISKNNGLPFEVPPVFVFDPADAVDFETKLSYLMTPQGQSHARLELSKLSFRWTWDDVVSRNLAILLP